MTCELQLCDLCISADHKKHGFIVIFVTSAEPTSAPLDLFVEDKNDTSVTIIWTQPAEIGPTGLDGYVIEVCKDGSKFCSVSDQPI